MRIIPLWRGWLIADWHEVLTKAWSVRLILIAAVLMGLETLVPYLPALLPWLPVWWLSALSFGLTVAAFLAKFIPQKNMGD